MLLEEYVNIVALEMAAPGNQHCANCIGTLLLPLSMTVLLRSMAGTGCC